MADVDIAIDEITDYVKLFLSSCHKYHSTLYDVSNSKNPFWNSPNFLSLLNLPRQIEQFGSMRLYWEGVNERYIQYIKPHLKNMRSSTTFLILKLDNIHKTNVLKYQLLNPLCNIKKYDRFKDCKKYKDLETVIDSIGKGNTLIGVIYKLNDTIQGVGVLVKDSIQDIIIKLRIDDESGYHLNHLWFTKICPDEKIKFVSSNSIEY